jgi:predicted nucleic acid-binding protein
MIILDTNVLSVLMQKIPEPQVIAWLDEQPAESIWTTTISVYEIHFGLEILDDGNRKKQLQIAFEKVMTEDLSQRILNFDHAAAREAALISAEGRKTGRSIEIRDALIAGLVRARRAELATRNVRHFENCDISVSNPWDFSG